MVTADALQLRGVPGRMRILLAMVIVGAVAAPVLVRHVGPTVGLPPAWVTVLMLLAVSVLNVEIGRALTGGLERSQQPHKALSAWAFTSALLLSPSALLLIVPLTYAHAWWRGLRVVLWKWIGSAAYLILAGIGAAVVRRAIMHGQGNLMAGDGGRGFTTMLAAAVTFLVIETLLFTGSATLNTAADEVWLRSTLTSASFYLTEAGVLLVGGLLAGVWGAGPWFVLLFAPIYVLLQRAALHEPMRERAAAAAELATKNDELERANQFKVDLMGMLGHEIGNPLTSIQGFAEIGAQALDDGDPALARDAFGYVERSALQVQQVRSEILDMVRSDRGALTAHPEPCELLPVLEHAVASQPVGSRPALDCPAGLTALVQPSHLDQIVTNLLSNATKYGGGATCVRARATGAAVEVSVEDAGPGVPPEFRHQLFERFSRDDGTSREQLGTGLGLFITRELARANHARIRHRDAVPHGAIFTLTLPAT